MSIRKSLLQPSGHGQQKGGAGVNDVAVEHTADHKGERHIKDKPGSQSLPIPPAIGKQGAVKPEVRHDPQNAETDHKEEEIVVRVSDLRNMVRFLLFYCRPKTTGSSPNNGVFPNHPARMLPHKKTVLIFGVYLAPRFLWVSGEMKVQFIHGLIHSLPYHRRQVHDRR